MQEAGTGWLVCFVTRIRLRDQLLFIWAAEESACIILCTRLENNEMKWINMEENRREHNGQAIYCCWEPGCEAGWHADERAQTGGHGVARLDVFFVETGGRGYTGRRSTAAVR